MRRCSLLQYGLIISVLLGLPAAALVYSEDRQPRAAEYPIERHVRYSFTLRNTQAQPLRKVEVRAEAPFLQSSTQRSVSVKASEPFELRVDELGNQTLHLKTDLAPLSSKVIWIDAVVAFSPLPDSEPLGSGSREFLCAAPYVETGHPAIQRTAATFRENSDVELASEIFRWVADHVYAESYQAERRGAVFALEQGRGDCTEAADLFVALARARGIAARTVAGFVVDRDAVLRPGAYHNWAEVFVDGAWRVVDPNRRVLSPTSEQYLAMRVMGTCSAERPMEFPPRVSVANPNVRVGMG